MGQLAGFNYRSVARRLRKFGYVFDIPGPRSHEVWRHRITGRKITLPRCPHDTAEGTLRAVLREAQIAVEDFLNVYRNA